MFTRRNGNNKGWYERIEGSTEKMLPEDILMNPYFVPAGGISDGKNLSG
jgi:hypothetical protein